MQCQAQGGAYPGKLLGRFGRQGVGMVRMLVLMMVMVIVRLFIAVATIFRIALWQIMMMKVKKALQEKHGEEAPEHPGDSAVKGRELFRCMRQKVQQRYSEHETGD